MVHRTDVPNTFEFVILAAPAPGSCCAAAHRGRPAAEKLVRLAQKEVKEGKVEKVAVEPAE